MKGDQVDRGDRRGKVKLAQIIFIFLAGAYFYLWHLFD